MNIDEIGALFANVNGRSVLKASAGGSNQSDGFLGSVQPFTAGVALALTGVYYSINELSFSSTDTNVAFSTMPYSGTLSNLNITLNNALPSTAIRTYTIYRNGAATPLAVSLAVSTSAGADSTDVVTFAPGDKINVFASGSGEKTATNLNGQVVITFI